MCVPGRVCFLGCLRQFKSAACTLCAGLPAQTATYPKRCRALCEDEFKDKDLKTAQDELFKAFKASCTPKLVKTDVFLVMETQHSAGSPYAPAVWGMLASSMHAHFRFPATQFFIEYVVRLPSPHHALFGTCLVAKRGEVVHQSTYDVPSLFHQFLEDAGSKVPATHPHP